MKYLIILIASLVCASSAFAQSFPGYSRMGSSADRLQVVFDSRQTSGAWYIDRAWKSASVSFNYGGSLNASLYNCFTGDEDGDGDLSDESNCSLITALTSDVDLPIVSLAKPGIWVEITTPENSTTPSTLYMKGSNLAGGGSWSGTVAQLPATGTEGILYQITDGASATDCATGSGANDVGCIWNGSSYQAVGVAATGLTNPLVADMNGGGFDITNVVEVDGRQIDQTELVVRPAGFTGADIQTAINAAVSADPADGAILELPTGTYTNVEITLAPPIKEVRCAGNARSDCVLQGASYIRGTTTIVQVDPVDIYEHGLWIHGFTIDGNKQAWIPDAGCVDSNGDGFCDSDGTTPVGTLWDPTFAGAQEAHRCLLVDDASVERSKEILIENMHIHSCGSELVRVEYADNTRIENNLLAYAGCFDNTLGGGATWTGVDLAEVGCGTWADTAPDEQNQPGRKSNGVGVEIGAGSDNAIIKNNIIEYFTKIGVQPIGGTTEDDYPDNVRIESNVIRWGGSTGIALVNSQTSWVIDNHVSHIDADWGFGNVGKGMSCIAGNRNTVIQGNYFEDLGGTGIDAACGCGLYQTPETPGVCDAIYIDNVVDRPCQQQTNYYGITVNSGTLGYSGTPTGRLTLVNNRILNNSCTAADTDYNDESAFSPLVIREPDEIRSGTSINTGTGTIQGSIEVDTSGATPYAISSALGQIVYFDEAGAGEIDLPAASSGAQITIYNTTANAITVDPNGSEVIWLNGTAASAGEAIVSNGAAGEIVSLVSDGTNWYTVSTVGTWAEAIP